MSRAAVGPPGHRWWPPALPGADLDYTDALDAVQAQGDSVAVASLAIEPSGTGERQAIDLSINGYTLTAQFTGGVPGRVYRNQITITGVSGRVWQWVISQVVSTAAALPPVCPVPPALVPGFGTAITWSSGATVFGPAIAAVATGLIGTGTTQATALSLMAATNFIASAPAETGFVLPEILVSGTIVVQNDDPSHSATIYPPVGAQIQYAGTTMPMNTPFDIDPNGSANFSTNSAGTLWIAGGSGNVSLAWLGTLPATRPTSGWWNNGGIAEYVYPS